MNYVIGLAFAIGVLWLMGKAFLPEDDTFMCGCGWIGKGKFLRENGECPKCSRAEEVISAKDK